eukprot:CAMPEP_0201219886 /NCGR_PEP_ID=MMETSP0851-20130426/191306_1 /ASSEMBLY_ACC=CAM_ASM_000631 /TAXON_ID=183588 /ORGANISM="Pseudo-nitzschia fraudulenta, Strain WWA7" /LENGTH=291 /DNA_ID=CAMNT_0047509583 /DNA_START=122 /DNA_END=997 /DNA_ORIENTATION=+
MHNGGGGTANAFVTSTQQAAGTFAPREGAPPNDITLAIMKATNNDCDGKGPEITTTTVSSSQASVDKDEESQSLPLLLRGHSSNQREFYKSRRSSDFTTFGYASNPTVFGRILRGELKTRFLAETDDLLVFQDIQPRAPLHCLVIPKRWISSVLDLASSGDSENSVSLPSLSLLEEMKETARTLVRDRYPEAYEQNDYVLCFHIPPFNSVDHLHLHVLAPASSMADFYRYWKYNTGGMNFHVRWCTSLRDVVSRLDKGSPPTPYRKDDSWTTVLSDTITSIRGILSSQNGG